MGLKSSNIWRFLLAPQLKSDQNGIEIRIGFKSFITVSICVKIRPKWDWNILCELLYVFTKNVKIRPKWDWNANWVFLYVILYFVKIRPKWDWNWFSPQQPPRASRPLKSDQNGIEIYFKTILLTYKIC